ncbi:peptidoglycan recognition protein family protein [Bradyrhizobium barranii]
MSKVHVRNRLRPHENVVGAAVTITGIGPGLPSLSGITNAHGVVDLDTTGLADGIFTLTVAPAHTLVGPVGPNTAATLPSSVTRIFRTLSADLTVTAHKPTAISVSGGSSADGEAMIVTPSTPTISLQPCFMRSPNHSTRGSHGITMIIVHHTAAGVESTLSTFMAAAQTSANYVIDRDGQIIKVVPDRQAAFHAGESKWSGLDHINSRSIGIEIVNTTGFYPTLQYSALLGLISALRSVNASIIDWNIIGHSDIATSHGRLGRKSSDPGLRFEWSRLESRSFGMTRSIGPFPGTIYDSFFAAFAGSALRKGDNDGKRILGGSRRNGTFTGNPVRKLQDDLTTIGYHLGTPDGDYGDKTRLAVEMFQEHFFAGGRGHKAPDGLVDLQTAIIIKGVAAAKP